MNKKGLKIVYMGTPDFAVAPLQELVENKYNVVAVVTAPDRPAGRGKKIRHSAVKVYAQAQNLSILQPEKLKSPEFTSALQALSPDLMVVVAFRMLPEVVWSLPSIGTFNLHASLLPQYRGAAPINHALINGERFTGVTTFLIDAKIDTGKILLQEEIPVGDEENVGELHDRLMELGAGLVRKTVDGLAEGSLEARSQNQFSEKELKSAPKIYKEDCLIDWNKPGREIFNLVRGLSPYPAAFTRMSKEDGKLVLFKVFSASFEAAIHRHTPGSIHLEDKKAMKVAVPDGYIHILSLQQEGKKRMDVGAYLLGVSPSIGSSRFS